MACPKYINPLVTPLPLPDCGKHQYSYGASVTICWLLCDFNERLNIHQCVLVSFSLLDICCPWTIALKSCRIREKKDMTQRKRWSNQDWDWDQATASCLHTVGSSCDIDWLRYSSSTYCLWHIQATAIGLQFQMALCSDFDATALSVQISGKGWPTLWKSDSINAIDYIIVECFKQPLPPHHHAVLLAPQ